MILTVKGTGPTFEVPIRVPNNSNLTAEALTSAQLAAVPGVKVNVDSNLDTDSVFCCGWGICVFLNVGAAIAKDKSLEFLCGSGVNPDWLCHVAAAFGF